MERKTVSIRIDPEIWKEAKKQAIEMEMSIGQIVETALIHLKRK